MPFVEGPVIEGEVADGGVSNAFVLNCLGGGLAGAGEGGVACYHPETGGKGADFGAASWAVVGGVEFVVN